MKKNPNSFSMPVFASTRTKFLVLGLHDASVLLVDHLVLVMGLNVTIEQRDCSGDVSCSFRWT